MSKLDNASMKFHLACVVKLKEKEKEGWVGWDNISNQEIFEKRLTRHLLKEYSQGGLIDISNYSMFLWNLIESEKELKNEQN